MFGLQFHLYGFLIGLSIVILYYLAQKKAQEHHLSEKIFDQMFFLALLGALLGARLWHVVTDFQYYQNDLLAVFAIFNGGLSILGAVSGGFVAVFSYAYFKSHLKELKIFLNSLALYLPVAQAIGRIGNFVNQELYGLPSNWPIAIYIDPAHRLTAYQSVERYHPLFFYEAFLLIMVALFLQIFLKKRKIDLKKDPIFLYYLFAYAIIRFFLEFLRLEKTLFFNGPFSFNQVIIAVFLSIFLFKLFFIKKC